MQQAASINRRVDLEDRTEPRGIQQIDRTRRPQRVCLHHLFEWTSLSSLACDSCPSRASRESSSPGSCDQTTRTTRDERSASWVIRPRPRGRSRTNSFAGGPGRFQCGTVRDRSEPSSRRIPTRRSGLRSSRGWRRADFSPSTYRARISRSASTKRRLGYDETTSGTIGGYAHRVAHHESARVGLVLFSTDRRSVRVQRSDHYGRGGKRYPYPVCSMGLRRETHAKCSPG